MSNFYITNKFKQDKLEPCGCGVFIPFAFDTSFPFIERHTLMCAHCGKKVSTFNEKKLFYKWNKRCKK